MIKDNFHAEHYKQPAAKAAAIMFLDRYRWFLMGAVEMQVISIEVYQKEIEWVEDQAKILVDIVENM